MPLSRRDALTLLLGAPLAAHACSKAPSSIPGSIRGGSLDFGHVLRSESRAILSGPTERLGTAIVGAGVAGLAAAWRLKRGGDEDFVVFDLEGQPGGTAAYGTDGVTPYPWGAHYLPLPTTDNPNLVELLLEMGAVERAPGARAGLVGREAELVREPEERLFLEGAWHEGLFPFAIASREDLLELERFNRLVQHWAAFRDAEGKPAFTLPVRRCSRASNVLELDTLSAAAFLEREGFRSQVLGWYLEYACRDDYGLLLKDTSAWALLFYFCARATPDGTSAPFLTWPEGNGRVVRHFQSRIGGKIRLGELVTEVLPATDRAELRTVNAGLGQTTRYVADRVIVAAPRFIACRLLEPWRRSPPEWLSRFSYAPWLVANLHLRDRPKSRGAEPAWDNVLYDSASLGYVTATHQTFRDRGPTIWTYYQPLTRGTPSDNRRALLELSQPTCADAIVADLGRAHSDLRARLERIDVWRWGHAMIRPVPGLVASGALALAEKPLGVVHFAHTDLSGVALFEEAFDHGVRAAEEVLAARGRLPGGRT